MTNKDEQQNSNEKISGIDFLKISYGKYIKDAKLYDSNDRCLGDIPRYDYSSLDEYEKELKRTIESLEGDIELNLGDDESIESLENKAQNLLWTRAGKDKFVFEPISWKKFREIPKREKLWRIENLIPNEGIVILASSSGEKKTWLAMEMARSIVKGIPFLGDEKFKSSAGRVLYLDLEMAQGEFSRRAKLLGFNEIEDDLWLSNSDALNLGDEKVFAQFIKFIKEKEISFVVIDTFRAVAGGIKEEKAEEIRKFFNSFKWVKNSNVSILFIDHCRKPHQFEGKTPKKEQLFASQDKLASVEVLLMIRSEARKDEIYMHQVKNRIARECEPFKISMNDELDSTLENVQRITLKYEGEFENTESKKDEAKEIFLNILQEEPRKRKELLQIAKDKQIGQKNASDALRELQNVGIILMQKKGKENLYSLSDKSIIDPTAPEQGNLIDSD